MTKSSKSPNQSLDAKNKGKVDKVSYLFVEEQLRAKFWDWTNTELTALNQGAAAIMRVIMSRLAAAEIEVVAAYGILHDQDMQRVWSEARGEYIDRPKEGHVHLMFRVTKPIVPGRFAETIGMRDTDFIRPMKKGGAPVTTRAAGRVPAGWDGMLSYLIHESDRAKHRYNPSEVVTAAGPAYEVIHAERYQAWRERGAYKLDSVDQPTAKYLAELATSGRLSKAAVMADPWLYRVYAGTEQATRAIDHGWAMAGERRSYDASRAVRAGLMTTTVIYVHGQAGSGKSRLGADLADHLVAISEQVGDRPWSVYRAAPTNPLDSYRGEEILFLDEARPDAFSAAGWLALMDPEQDSHQVARYRNKEKVAPRVIIITNTRPPVEFFMYTRGKGDIAEAMSQFIRRLTRVVEVRQTEGDSREYAVSEVSEVAPYTEQVITSSSVESISLDRRIDLIAGLSQPSVLAHLATVVDERDQTIDLAAADGWVAAQDAVSEEIAAWMPPSERDQVAAEITALAADIEALTTRTRELDNALVATEDAARDFGDEDFTQAAMNAARRDQLPERVAIKTRLREARSRAVGLLRRHVELTPATLPALSAEVSWLDTLTDLSTYDARTDTLQAIDDIVRDLTVAGCLPPAAPRCPAWGLVVPGRRLDEPPSGPGLHNRVPYYAHPVPQALADGYRTHDGIWYLPGCESEHLTALSAEV